MKEDVDTLKDDWLTDTARLAHRVVQDCLADLLLQIIAFWEEYVSSYPGHHVKAFGNLKLTSYADISNANTLANTKTLKSYSSDPPCHSC